MTERLADVSHRLASVGQLAEVIGAMRALAAARAREAHARLDGVRAYTQDIADAIGRALPLVDRAHIVEPPAGAKGRLALLAFGAEQGFAGAFNARLVDAAAAAAAYPEEKPTLLMLIGSRALAAAEARGIIPVWSHPMIVHLDRAAALAEAIVARLFEGLASGDIGSILLLHAAPGVDAAPVERRLAPFDYSRFPSLKEAQPPLVNMPPPALLSRLAEEHVFAEIVEAAILSFAAENEARLRAMTKARRHVDELLQRLNARARALRQEEITNEIIELAADADAMAIGSGFD
jgi:F-type H+-transporting ATPase subunit gamma